MNGEMDPPSKDNQYFHPVSGEPISKNAWKKLQKTGGVEKVKKVKEKGKDEKKEKKPEKEKPAEIQYADNTPLGDKKRIEEVFPPSYQPKYVESAWQSWWEKSGFYGADALDLLTTESSSSLLLS